MKSIKKQVLLYCSVLSFLQGIAQEEITIPKNYVGLYGGLEWNTISAVSGVDYERIIFYKNKISMGIKGSYIFGYAYENLALFYGSCCESASITSVLITGTFYPAQTHDNSGFFLHAGLGIAGKNHSLGNLNTETRISPAADAGFGLNFRIGKKFRIRWMNTVSFPSSDGGITVTKLAFGF